MSDERGGTEGSDSADGGAETPPPFRWSLRAGEPLPPEIPEPAGDDTAEAGETAAWDGPPTEAFVWDPAADAAAEGAHDAAADAPPGGDPTEFMTQPMTRQDIEDTLVPLEPTEVHIATPYVAQPTVRLTPLSEDETSTIDSLFAEDAFRDYEDSILPPAARPAPSPRTVPSTSAPRPPLAPAQRVLLWIAGLLVVAIALVALFVLGTRIAARSPEAKPENITQPTVPTSSSEPVTPPADGAPALEPGVHPWNALAGGECIEPFGSAWEEEFTVVGCGSDHGAQLVARGALDEPEGAAFPGVKALQSQIGLLCATPEVIDYPALATIDDVRVSASFPATEADWATGNRAYYCFVSRASGKTLPGNVVLGAQ